MLAALWRLHQWRHFFRASWVESVGVFIRYRLAAWLYGHFPISLTHLAKYLIIFFRFLDTLQLSCRNFRRHYRLTIRFIRPTCRFRRHLSLCRQCRITYLPTLSLFVLTCDVLLKNPILLQRRSNHGTRSLRHPSPTNRFLQLLITFPLLFL